MTEQYVTDTRDKILIIDDDPRIFQGIRRRLHKQFNLLTATSGDRGIELLRENGPIAVVVCDMKMPGRDGIDVLTEIAELAPDTVRVMLTGQADMGTAVEAINRGNIFRFFTKPCPIEMLAEGLEAALEQYRLITAERDLLDNTLSGSINLLTDILAMMDPDSFGRAEKTRRWCRAIAKELKLQKHMWKFELATTLLPIGFAALPPDVAKKARQGSVMSPIEQDMVSATAEIAHKLIDNIPRLGEVATYVRFQGKNFDGSGGPKDDLAGTDIPVGARIVRILNDLVAAEQRGQTARDALTAMSGQNDIYDPKLLSLITPVILREEEAASRSGAASIEVAIHELRPGDVIESPIQDLEQQTLILAVGTVVTDIYLERLRNLRKIRPLTERVTVNRGGDAPPLAEAS